jgi:hypothetical protein
VIGLRLLSFGAVQMNVLKTFVWGLCCVLGEVGRQENVR